MQPPAAPAKVDRTALPENRDPLGCSTCREGPALPRTCSPPVHTPVPGADGPA